MADSLDATEVEGQRNTSAGDSAIASAENIVQPDTSVYNCKTCLGWGLIGDPQDPKSYVCPHCGGTGKEPT